MEQELTIREATIEDIDTIKELADIIWPDAYKEILAPGQIVYMMNMFYSKESLQDQFGRHRFLIGYHGKAPIAFASYSTTREAGTYKLHKIYVDTRTRAKGIGRALIQYILASVKVAGGTSLELNVNRQNTARHFYEKLGFNIIREEDTDIGYNYWMNDFVMSYPANNFKL